MLAFPPLLHAGQPDPTGWLHSDWHIEPTVVAGVLALAALYLWQTGEAKRRVRGAADHPISGKQRAFFLFGCLTLAIALNPPLDDWSDHYLVSAHMFQHLLLMFLVAPLLLAGMPGWLVARALRSRWLERPMYVLTRPVVAIGVANAVIVVWHLPFAYDAAVRHEPVHIVQHLMFIGAAIIAWWPVLGSMPSWPKLAPPLQALYLFGMSIPGGIVGAFITLAQPGLYTAYVGAPRIWGISLDTDQQVAGLMMWVLTSVIYLVWITAIFLTWASREEAADRGERSRRSDPSTPSAIPGVR